MRSHITKWGKSLAVPIPNAIARKADLKPGDFVELTIAETGKLKLQSVSGVPSLSQLVSRITPENRHSEVQVGSVKKEFSEW